MQLRYSGDSVVTPEDIRIITIDNAITACKDAEDNLPAVIEMAKNGLKAIIRELTANIPDNANVYLYLHCLYLDNQVEDLLSSDPINYESIKALYLNKIEMIDSGSNHDFNNEAPESLVPLADEELNLKNHYLRYLELKELFNEWFDKQLPANNSLTQNLLIFEEKKLFEKSFYLMLDNTFGKVIKVSVEARQNIDAKGLNSSPEYLAKSIKSLSDLNGMLSSMLNTTDADLASSGDLNEALNGNLLIRAYQSYKSSSAPDLTMCDPILEAAARLGAERAKSLLDVTQSDRALVRPELDSIVEEEGAQGTDNDLGLGLSSHSNNAPTLSSDLNTLGGGQPALNTSNTQEAPKLERDNKGPEQPAPAKKEPLSDSPSSENVSPNTPKPVKSANRQTSKSKNPISPAQEPKPSEPNVKLEDNLLKTSENLQCPAMNFETKPVRSESIDDRLEACPGIISDCPDNTVLISSRVEPKPFTPSGSAVETSAKKPLDTYTRSWVSWLIIAGVSLSLGATGFLAVNYLALSTPVILAQVHLSLPWVVASVLTVIGACACYCLSSSTNKNKEDLKPMAQAMSVDGRNESLKTSATKTYVPSRDIEVEVALDSSRELGNEFRSSLKI